MIETLRPGAHALNARVALFDFDGTLSRRAGRTPPMRPPSMPSTLWRVCETEEQRSTVLTGHRATIVSHLGTLDGKLGKKIRWDGEAEKITGENGKILGRDWRALGGNGSFNSAACRRASGYTFANRPDAEPGVLKS